MYFSNLPRISAILGIASIGLISPTLPAFAQDETHKETAEEAKLRVNLAGRQRMLTQRMTSAACFIELGIDVHMHHDMLAEAHDLFVETNYALSHGDEELGLFVERDPSVVVGLARIDRDWVQFAPLVEEILAKDEGDTAGLEHINEIGLLMLRHADTVVHLIEDAHQRNLPHLSDVLARTINLAGRQRMFTQRIAKDFCLIDSGFNVEANMEHLADHQQYFNATLTALHDGFSGVLLPAPTDEIRIKLEEVAEVWQAPNAVITAVIGGAEISDQDRHVIALEMEHVLVTMDEAVKLYQEFNHD